MARLLLVHLFEVGHLWVVHLASPPSCCSWRLIYCQRIMVPSAEVWRIRLRIIHLPRTSPLGDSAGLAGRQEGRCSLSCFWDMWPAIYKTWSGRTKLVTARAEEAVREGSCLRAIIAPSSWSPRQSPAHPAC